MPEGFVYLQVLLMEMSQVYYTIYIQIYCYKECLFSYNNYYCMTQ